MYELQLPDDMAPLRFGNARNHGRIKWAVNKATRFGVEVREAKHPEQLRAWYALYVETMRAHARLPIPRRFFEAIWELSPGGSVRLLLAEQAGAPPPRRGAGAPAPPAAVIDLPPPVLALLGLPPLPDADGRARTDLVHRVRLDPESRLAQLLDETVVEVNSLHHQAVKRLAGPLRISGRADDGVIEAVESGTHRFLIAVQWHPEEIDDLPWVRRLFSAFAAAASG